MVKTKRAGEGASGNGIGMLEQAVKNHVESFDAFVEGGLTRIGDALEAVQVDPQDPKDPSIIVNLTELTLKPPMTDGNNMHCSLYPRDCRLGQLTYSGMLTGKFECQVGDSTTTTSCQVDLGKIPIMVRSAACSLRGLKPKELVAKGEDETESGGYFVLHGLERVIRMLIMPRANFPMAVCRPSYMSRGKLYTKYAVLMRCMRPDGTTQTNSLHYTSDGGAFVRFSHSREEWLIPLLVAAHACYDITDQALAEMMAGRASGAMKGSPNDEIWTCVLVMLQQQNAKERVSGRSNARQYLGRTFRIILGSMVPARWTDEQIGDFIVRRFFMVHTEDPRQKQLSLVVMFHKLMGLVTGEVEADNQDTMSSHEVLTPGPLYGAVLKEGLEVMMGRLRALIAKVIRKGNRGRGSDKEKQHRPEDFRSDSALLQTYVKMAGGVDKVMEHFLATGNVNSRSGLDLMQVSGYTIVADKLNQARFSSHFAAVHRGQYFAEMKTTTVRKLLPETWGFLCPVHTPDGAPCGLLNHLAASCRPVVHKPPVDASQAVVGALISMGVHAWIKEQSDWEPTGLDRTKQVWIMLDGCPIGHVEIGRVKHVEQALRAHKMAAGSKNGFPDFPDDLEIVCISRKLGLLFPGLFLFLGPGRLIRPVRCLRTNKVEIIGPLEQLFLHIACLTDERKRSHAALEARASKQQTLKSEELPEQLPLEYSHEELEPTRMLSVLASLTPFSNHNQSPRNMYQCQMLKQTMGTPYHNHECRTDNKVYKIYYPQKPLVRTDMYDKVHCDLHPVGMNAVISVITYTGYDMEDAMIINKSSYERGFGHGIIYKTKVIEASESKNLPIEQRRQARFRNVVLGPDGSVLRRFSPNLDDNGAPAVGVFLNKGADLCCTVDHTGQENIHHYKDEEGCYVENVSLVDGRDWDKGEPCERLVLRLRYPRNPVVGDKFSSRHGQKGVMSILWPAEDMPFTESGLTPDILFNPHGFPSRMTIGMLIETIASKAACQEGQTKADGTTFRGYTGNYCEDGNNEDDPFLKKNNDAPAGPAQAAGTGPIAAEYFGSQLAKHGFQRLGTERMYSGVHGHELETDIFVGVVYYQRLRHLVSDKAQARSRGPNDRVTNQPVKGRKKGGGIRFGEMERDSLLGHGTSFLLHDRLMRCSDFDVAYVCPLCGSVLTPQANVKRPGQDKRSQSQRGDPWECPPCSQKTGKPVRCHSMPVPWIFRYLAVEMAAMNVKMKMTVADRARQVSLSSPSAMAVEDAK